jgi:tRNA nucleotidyltransferase/poly(A) polymerase
MTPLKRRFYEPFLPTVNQYKHLFDALEYAGARPIFVGGCVRDVILGRAFIDIDIEVYNVSQERLESLLKDIGGFQYTGRAFGVYRKGHLEIALPRLEIKTGTKHTDFDIKINPHLSFEKAAIRRDLTINAMGYDWFGNQFLDPFDGLIHCQNKVLEAGNQDTFREDELRALRVAQFIGRLQFEPTDALERLCATAKLGALSKERIGTELRKLLWKSEVPSKGFNFLEKTELIKQLFLEKYALEQRSAFYQFCDLIGAQPTGLLKEKGVYSALFWYAPSDTTWLQAELVSLGFFKKDVIWGLHTNSWLQQLTAETAAVAGFHEALYQLDLLGVGLEEAAGLIKALTGTEALVERIQAVDPYLLIPKVQAVDLIDAGVVPGPAMAKYIKTARLVQFQEPDLSKAALLNRILGGIKI